MDGEAALRFRFGCDKVCDGFGLQKIQTVVEESAAGEFAGLGRAGTERGERGGDGGKDSAAAMEGKLNAILTGVAVGGEEGRDDGGV